MRKLRSISLPTKCMKQKIKAWPVEMEYFIVYKEYKKTKISISTFI